MTVTNTDRDITYEGNGATTVWPFGFTIPDVDSIVVQLTDVATGAETLVGSSDYTVTGIGSITGGSVTYPLAGSSLSSGTKLSIIRRTPILQSVSVKNQTAYNASVVERVWDKGRMIDQELAEEVHRAIKMPISSSTLAPNFPEPADARAIIWDGVNLDNGPTTTEISNAQGYAETAKQYLEDLLSQYLVIPISHDELSVTIAVGSLALISETTTPYDAITLEIQ